MALRSLALCGGVCGLDLGIDDVRADHRVVGIVERQAYCAAVLVARMAESALDRAPIWDDLRTFDGTRWRGAVDLVTAGFPCQPHSTAGKRAGLADDRWLWPDVWRITRDVGSGYLFMENVPGLVSTGGLAAILGDMAASGWNAEWDHVPAAAVGAPHLRDRIFILASHPGRHHLRVESERDQGCWRRERETECGDAFAVRARGAWSPSNANDERQQGERSGRLLDGEREALGDHAHRRGGEIADANDGGEPSESARRGEGIDIGGDGDGASANADRGRQWPSERNVCEGEPNAIGPVHPDAERSRHEGSQQAQAQGVGLVDEQLRRRRWPPPPEPTFRRVDDGPPHELDRDWADRIHALGNAVVRQAAGRAFRLLWDRLHQG